MAKDFCDKCSGPIEENNGKYVCLLCGATYGNAPAALGKSTLYSEFFRNVSLEKFRRISNRLANSIVMQTDVYLLAALSNGQFYSRFTPAPAGYDYVYHGQCAAERWSGVEKIYGERGFTIGIGYDGELFPTLIEHQQLFNRIKKTGVSNMRMREITNLSYRHTTPGVLVDTIEYEDTFLGVDINGKVVIYNPFEVFHLSKTRPDDVDRCKKLIKDITSWPPIKTLGGYAHWGITDKGDVFCRAFTNFEGGEKVAEELRSWKDIDDIVSFLGNNGGDYIYYGLKKDGTIVSTSSLPDNEGCRDVYTDIVQIKNLHGMGEGIFFLRRNGDLFCIGNRSVRRIAQNVVSVFEYGYVGANGKIYEFEYNRGRHSDTTKEIPGVKVFNSIETVEEEWAETIAAVKEMKDSGRKAEKEVGRHRHIMQGHQNKLDALRKERKSLGLFQRKEKAELDLKIDEISKLINQEMTTIQTIRESVKELPDATPVWSEVEIEGRHGNMSEAAMMAQISAAAYQAVSMPKKDRSVIKDAAVGAVIAGPAGAIIGAIYAADKNQRNKK